MYNKKSIDKLISFIENNNGIADKATLADIVQKEFSLIEERPVFACNDFAIRFCESTKQRMSNTVLALSTLKLYDDIPFIVCIVTPKTNYLLLANTTFLTKISHSSLELTVDNIKGSFNGSDIMTEYKNIKNSPQFFEQLFAEHLKLTFQDNLERLVESTGAIQGRTQKLVVTNIVLDAILGSIERAKIFLKSKEYRELKNDLDTRVEKVKNEIVMASSIQNVNIRGRIIEFLITENDSLLKYQIITALRKNASLPKFLTEDKLGDYSKSYPLFHTETDIKTKLMSLNSNPKAYNIEKLLEFLSLDKSVYMIYLIGIGPSNKFNVKLCSVFDPKLIDSTTTQHHWAGRNSRGVTQFSGNALTQILTQDDSSTIDVNKARDFLLSLINR